MMKKIGLLFGCALFMLPLNMKGQEKVVPLKYGNMDQWVTRKIHESGVIGGKTKLLYEVAPTKVIDGNEPYVNLGGSPWANSNVMAKVMGIVPIPVYILKKEEMDIAPVWRLILKVSKCWDWSISQCWLPDRCFWVI